MDILKLNSKENIANSYGVTPTLPYDVEGKLVEKNGKDLKIEKTIDNKTVYYSLRVKEDVVAELGEDITIEKENIVSSKVEEKNISQEKTLDSSSSRSAEDILRELGLEYTAENIRMVEFFLSTGISVNKTNVESFVKSKEHLNTIVGKIEPKYLVKLLDKGIDLEGENLQKVAERLDEIDRQKEPFSIKKFLKIDKEMTYKEAEIISKEIYGQKMGKDVYDTIIELDKQDLPITKENIDKALEVMSKLHNLKSLEDGTYVKIINENMEFNIDNLYKLNNSYTNTAITDNGKAKVFEEFTIKEQTTVENLKEVLKSLNIEDNTENIKIIREFIVNDMVIDKEKYSQLMNMKDSIKELLNLLNTDQIVSLNEKEVDILKEPIDKLLNEIKANVAKDKISLDTNNIKEVKENLELLGKVTEKDLLNLIKQGEDFTINSLKEVIDSNINKDLSLNHKVMDKSIEISNMFNVIGDRINPATLDLTIRKYNTITLNNLYMAQKEINTSEETLSPVDTIHEGLIFEEYLRAKSSLTVNMVRDSIREVQTIEHMPIEQLNNYINKKINRYKESQRITDEVKSLKGKENILIPIIMKNQLNMTLGEIKEIDSFLTGEKSISSILDKIIDPNNSDYKEDIKEGIKLIQEKISTTMKSDGQEVKEDYKNLMNLLNQSETSNSDNSREEKPKDEYMKIHRKVSSRDLVFQLPIEIDNEYKNLNIIVPNTGKDIDKNNMSFLVSLDTTNLGTININLDVKSKEINLQIEEDSTILKDRLSILEDSLKSLGYTLSK